MFFTISPTFGSDVVRDQDANAAALGFAVSPTRRRLRSWANPAVNKLHPATDWGLGWEGCHEIQLRSRAARSSRCWGCSSC